MLIEFKFMPWIYHHLSLCQKEKERHFPRKEACKYTLLVHVMSLEVGFAMHLKESVDSASEWDIPLSLRGRGLRTVQIETGYLII